MASRGRTLLGVAFTHWLTTAGVVFTTTSALVFIGLAFQSFSNPYYGLIVFVFIPALFVVGLLMIPAGLYLKAKKTGSYRSAIPEVEWSSPRTVRIASLIGMLTVANIAIVSAASYQGMHYVDSNQFCGTVCHSVMNPQYVRYQESGHARVACVNCHIGSGATSFVRYKLAGARQLAEITLNRYNRPIPPAMATLRPAKETCEQCHSPKKDKGELLRVIRRYDEDEQSTEKFSVLLMHVGGKIHKAHVGRKTPIEYIPADAARQVIPWVSVDGKEYVGEGTPAGEKREMDCMDCHNRPAHDFELPAQAVDRAIAEGRLDRSRPFTKRDAVQALTGKAPLENAPEAVRTIYSKNIFPQMAITWSSYPNNLGHTQFSGCFRCHDDNHKNKSGETISQDCASCHELLAVDEKDPEILKQFGAR
jgi:nitrate/TMAO reductase-like tetraheme cytochrome c subunit